MRTALLRPLFFASLVAASISAAAPRAAALEETDPNPPDPVPDPVVASSGLVLGAALGASVPIGVATSHYSAVGAGLQLEAGTRFATHGVLLGHVEGAIFPSAQGVSDDSQLRGASSRTVFVGGRVGYVSDPGRYGFVATVGAGWRVYSYDVNGPNIGYLRTGPEAQASFGITVPVSPKVAIVPKIDFGGGALVTNGGCCERETPFGPMTDFQAMYPGRVDPYAFAFIGAAVAFDGGIVTAPPER